MGVNNHGGRREVGEGRAADVGLEGELPGALSQPKDPVAELDYRVIAADFGASDF